MLHGNDNITTEIVYIKDSFKKPLWYTQRFLLISLKKILRARLCEMINNYWYLKTDFIKLE